MEKCEPLAMGTDVIGYEMIEPVEQTDFQKLEATTRGSLASQNRAESLRRILYGLEL